MPRLQMGDTYLEISIQEYMYYDMQWGKINVEVKNRFIHYEYRNKELLTKDEVEFIIMNLEQLLSGEMKEEIMIGGMEPNLSFLLVPGTPYEQCRMSVDILFEGSNGYCGGHWSSTYIEQKMIEKFLQELKKEHDRCVKNMEQVAKSYENCDDILFTVKNP
ncbi:MAG: hypothetical protein Q4G58_09240 [bacterium]|nr:hypothetical protein [bacterium]